MKFSNLTDHGNILDAIIESSYDGLWICDAQGVILKVNRASERINGIRSSDVIGRNVKDLVKEGVFDKSVTLEVIKKKKRVTIVQKLKSGRQLLVTGNPVFIGGQLKYIVTNDRDITELSRLRRNLEDTQAIKETYYKKLQETLENGSNGHLIFCSKEMKKVFETIERVSKVDVTVFLQGESGVGKTHIARMIHNYSERSNFRFIHVDCGVIPENLMESELFGYVEGAFTGAKREGKAGLVEIAHRGTLFLDEITEMPLGLQVKLLHFLDSGKMKRIGDTDSKEIDVRIIAASNRNVEKYVRDKLFREDLYFRLNIVPITIPPLRSRRDDIPLLVAHFLQVFTKKYRKRLSMSPHVVDILYNYEFPGNIRELSNLVERMVVMAETNRITEKDIPTHILENLKKDFLPFDEAESWVVKKSLREIIESLEEEIFRKLVEESKTQLEIARILGISQPTVARKLRKYNICRCKDLYEYSLLDNIH